MREIRSGWISEDGHDRYCPKYGSNAKIWKGWSGRLNDSLFDVANAEARLRLGCPMASGPGSLGPEWEAGDAHRLC